MSEEINGIYVGVTTVADNDSGDDNSEDWSVKQHAVSSDSVICKDSSTAEIKIQMFFFSEMYKPK
jgi:hypothetical protein